MSIEIKQLLIKSNIVQRAECGTDESSAEQNAAKEEILLEECRRMILDIMREKEER